MKAIDIEYSEEEKNSQNLSQIREIDLQYAEDIDGSNKANKFDEDIYA